MIWFSACWLWCNNIWLDWQCTLYLSTCACSSTCWQWPEGNYKIESVHPVVCRGFSWNWITRFRWISAWCWKPISSCAWQSHISWKDIFCPNNLGKWVQNKFFLVLKKCFSFFWICSVMKMYIISCVCAFLFSQSDCRILNLQFLQNKSIKQPHF